MSGWLLRDLLLNLLLRAKVTDRWTILGEAGQCLLFETAGAGRLLVPSKVTDGLVSCSHGKKTPERECGEVFHMQSLPGFPEVHGKLLWLQRADGGKQPAAHSNYADAPSASPQEKQERSLDHPEAVWAEGVGHSQGYTGLQAEARLA